MFQVLIADDERTVAEALRRSVKWEQLGMEVAEVARNGYEAIGIIESRQIDIAILDIRMPGIDGLELCGMIRDRKPQVQILIISGYAEFSYAQKAIRHGVVGYCLKPLDYAEVTKYLLKAKNMLAQKEGDAQRDLLEACLEQDSPAVIQILQKNGFERNSCFVAASAGEKPWDLPAREGITVLMGKGLWGYIMKSNYFSTREEWVMENASYYGLGYLERSVPDSDILQALEECSVMAYQYFADGERRVCTELEDGKADGWLNEIQQCVQRRQWEKVLGRIQELKYKNEQGLTVRSALRLCHIIYSSELFQGNAEDYYVYEIQQLVAQYQSLGRMAEEICQSICDARERKEDMEGSGNRSFLQLLDYVDRNYQGEISLARASEELHMNASYISQLFKKESGVTFVHYITQKRLDDAMDLLSTTQMRVADIAMQVGFNDYFYFQKTFKKFVGVSPAQYRAEA